MHIRRCLSTCPHSCSQRFAIVSLARCPPVLHTLAFLLFFSRVFRHEAERGITKRKSSRFSQQRFDELFRGERRQEEAARRRGARQDARLRGCEARSRGGTRVDELSARAENGQAARRVVASPCSEPVTTSPARVPAHALRNSREPSDTTRRDASPLVWLLERAEYERPN